MRSLLNRLETLQRSLNAGNPFHDESGRFTFSPYGSSETEKFIDKYIEKELNDELERTYRSQSLMAEEFSRDRGYDNPMKEVDFKEGLSLLKTHDIYYRGIPDSESVSKDVLLESMAKAHSYQDGTAGSGVYAFQKKFRGYAEDYARGDSSSSYGDQSQDLKPGYLVTLFVDRKAKKISYDEAEKLMYQASEEVASKASQRGGEKYYEHLGTSFYSDPGVFAMKLGYDLVETSRGELLILNKGVVKFRKQEMQK